MSPHLNANDHVESLVAASLMHAKAQGKWPEDAATVAELERLKGQIDAAAAHAGAELRRFRLLTCVAIMLLCATILLLHLGR